MTGSRGGMTKRGWWGAAVAAALAATTPWAGAAANAAGGPTMAPRAGPSFDCGKAKTPLERAICADLTLAAADRAVAEGYAKALAQVPPDWRDALRDSQRSWLADMAVICTPGDLPRLEGGATVASCRRNAFKARAEILAATLLNQAGYAFVALTQYAARPATADETPEGEAPGSIEFQSTRLQIARPKDAAERHWNAMIAQRMTALAGPSAYANGSSVVMIDSAEPGFIQATLNSSHERGPGGDSVKLVTVPWSLRLDRALTEKDLFGDPAVGVATVQRLATREMKKNADPSQPFDLKPADVHELVKPMRYWSLTRKGLDLTFDDDNAFGGAHYAAAALSVSLPWSDLAPYLRKDLPIDIKALRDGS